MLNVVLVNGNINRLRALVSGLHFASYLNRDVKFLWTNERICLDDAQDLFKEDFYQKYFIDENFYTTTRDLRSFKNGISYTSQNSIVIKGGKDGEQFFINKIYESEKVLQDYENIYIISGGIFYPPYLSESKQQILIERKKLYSLLEFHPRIKDKVNYLNNLINSDYIGLHLRYTDLIAHTPSVKTIINTTETVAKQLEIKKIYICSDNIKMKKLIKERLNDLGIESIENNTAEYRRGFPNANKSALIDWLMLANSLQIVHFGSSFAEEAIVYSKNPMTGVLVKSSRIRFLLMYLLQLSYILYRKSNNLIQDFYELKR